MVIQWKMCDKTRKRDLMKILNYEYVVNKQNLTIILIDDEPWFVGTEICKILEYSNSRDALSKHVDKEDKNTVAIRDGIQGNPNKTIINEAGLYSLIFSSKQERAKDFKRWITKEILPSIRKTGQYVDSKNKFEKLCPIKFGKEELKNEMGKRINKIGGQKKGGLAYYFAYLKFGNIIHFDFYHYSKQNNIKPIDWLKENNYYEQFCEFVCNQRV